MNYLITYGKIGYYDINLLCLNPSFFLSAVLAPRFCCNPLYITRKQEVKLLEGKAQKSQSVSLMEGG